MASVVSGESEDRKGYKSLALLLPIEAKYVTSYVTWLEELAEHVEASALNKADTLENYLRLILEDEKQNQLSEGDKFTCGEITDGNNDEEDSDWMDNVGQAAMKLNVAAMYTYLGDFPSALGHLSHLSKQHLSKLKLTSKHLQVIEYFRDSLEWSIKVLKGLAEESEGNKYTFLIKGTSKLNVQWEELSEEGDDTIRATLCFLKACLSAAMKVSEHITLEELNEAIALDPECYIWYHYAYRITRRIRRNVQRSSNSRLRPPSEEEELLAKRGYELAPNDLVTTTNYGLLIKEKLWMASPQVWENNEEEYLKCVELFRKALQLAVQLESAKWKRKITVYLAEFLCFGKGKKLDQDEGKRLFDECVNENPKSTFVLHKVGKLYHHGIYRERLESRAPVNDGKCLDLERALDYYQRAIESNPCNFACLMDMLKLQKRLNRHAEMISAINSAMTKAKRDYQVAKLHVIKAYVTWIYNPLNLEDHKSEAIKEFMIVLKELPEEFCREIYFTNDPIYLSREHPGVKVKQEIVDHLKPMQEKCEDDEEAVILAKWIGNLIKSIKRDRQPRVDWSKVRSNENRGEDGKSDDKLSEQMKGLSVSSRGNYQQRSRPPKGGGDGDAKSERHHSNGTGTENENMRWKGERGERKRSEADEDNAWRAKKSDEP